MIIYLGADHRGFELKEFIKDFLKEQGYEVADVGAKEYSEGDDYPDFASAAAKNVSLDPENSRAILICGSGTGMDITANKFRGVRSTVGFLTDQVYDARREDNINVLCLPADFITFSDAEKFVQVFLATPFSNEEKYQRRIKKIGQIEDTQCANI